MQFFEQSPIPKYQKQNVKPIDQTKKKKVMFKTEMDENMITSRGFSTQRKSYDYVNVENQIHNSSLRAKILELEAKNLQQQIQLQEKNNHISQLQKLINEQRENQLNVDSSSSNLQEQIQNLKSLENQCEVQKYYIEQMQLMKMEKDEWKNKSIQLQDSIQKQINELSIQLMKELIQNLSAQKVHKEIRDNNWFYQYFQQNKKPNYSLVYAMSGDTELSEDQNKYYNQQWPLELIKRSSMDYYDADQEYNEMMAEQNYFQNGFDEYLVWDIEPFKQEKKDIQILDCQPIKNGTINIENTIQHTLKKQPKFQNKSYCRYILLYVFRTIENNNYENVIIDICTKYQVNYIQFKEYYRKQRILIMGYQALKKELIIDNDQIEIQRRKLAFKDVLIWYMDKIATKQILNSKKMNLKEYLKFKNEIMAYYIHVPKYWLGNKAEYKK